jgi:hypothetical protein
VETAQHCSQCHHALVGPGVGMDEVPLDVGEHLPARGVEAIGHHPRGAFEAGCLQVAEQGVHRRSPRACLAGHHSPQALDIATGGGKRHRRGLPGRIRARAMLLASYEHHLQTRPVWSLPHLLDPEPRGRQRLFDLVLVSEAQGRFGDQPGTVGFEHIDRLERDQRQADLDQLGPGMHDSRTRDVHPVLGAAPRPGRPSLGGRAAGLEDQRAAGAQRPVGGGQRAGPIVVGEEYLGDVAGHGHQVDLKLRQRQGVTVDPADLVSTRLGPGYGQGGGRRVQPSDRHAPLGQEASEGSGAAADVQHGPGGELFDDSEVGVEVRAVVVEMVVDRGQARFGEAGINHAGLVVPRRPGWPRGGAGRRPPPWGWSSRSTG